MSVFVEPGSTKTISRALDHFQSHMDMVLTTMIEMGVRLLSLGVPLFGTVLGR